MATVAFCGWPSGPSPKPKRRTMHLKSPLTAAGLMWICRRPFYQNP